MITSSLEKSSGMLVQSDTTLLVGSKPTLPMTIYYGFQRIRFNLSIRNPHLSPYPLPHPLFQFYSDFLGHLLLFCVIVLQFLQTGEFSLWDNQEVVSS